MAEGSVSVDLEDVNKPLLALLQLAAGKKAFLPYLPGLVATTIMLERVDFQHGLAITQVSAEFS